VRQTIGDTLGIGGIFRGLRTIPVTVALARDMAEVCPDAYLLSYSNPMAMLPWAVYEGSEFTRVFGLCHSVRDTQAFLTRLTGADPERVRFLTAGFNHQAFVLRFEQDGESLYPRLAEVIDASPELQRRVRVEIYRRFGYFPTESSEHSAEYVPWFMRHDDQIEEFRIFVGDYLERSEENLRELEELRRALDSDDPLDLTPENELASLFIHALETGTERELHVNIRNGGLIASLPDECCVEVPCVVGAQGDQGPKPVPVGALPPQLAALNRTFLNVVELTVRAALEESRDRVYQAALLDPNTAATLTTAQTVAMCDDLFSAHRDLLPPAFRS
jgi:alpha-galactosidase